MADIPIPLFTVQYMSDQCGTEILTFMVLNWAKSWLRVSRDVLLEQIIFNYDQINGGTPTMLGMELSTNYTAVVSGEMHYTIHGMLHTCICDAGRYSSRISSDKLKPVVKVTAATHDIQY